MHHLILCNRDSNRCNFTVNCADVPEIMREVSSWYTAAKLKKRSDIAFSLRIVDGGGRNFEGDNSAYMTTMLSFWAAMRDITNEHITVSCRLFSVRRAGNGRMQVWFVPFYERAIQSASVFVEQWLLPNVCVITKTIMSDAEVVVDASSDAYGCWRDWYVDEERSAHYRSVAGEACKAVYMDIYRCIADCLALSRWDCAAGIPMTIDISGVLAPSLVRGEGCLYMRCAAPTVYYAGAAKIIPARVFARLNTPCVVDKIYMQSLSDDDSALRTIAEARACMKLGMDVDLRFVTPVWSPERSPNLEEYAKCLMSAEGPRVSWSSPE